jgi:hypothetical protein
MALKKGKSTSQEKQLMISRALDDDKYVLVSSFDLSSEYYVVSIDLLLKRLKIIGCMVKKEKLLCVN